LLFLEKWRADARQEILLEGVACVVAKWLLMLMLKLKLVLELVLELVHLGVWLMGLDMRLRLG
jgi:hypothetical protein